MAAITVVKQQLFEHHPGQVGYRELIGVGSFSTTDLTGTLDVTPLLSVFGVQLTTGAAAAAGTGTTAIESGDLGTVSATFAFTMIAPFTGTISAAKFVVDTTVATHASNIWTVGIVNTTQTLTPVDSATAANSNNSTGGAAFTADTVFALTLGAAGQLAVTAGDVLEWTFTKAASAANLVELSGSLLFTSATSANEDCYVTFGSDGLVAISSKAITIGRKAVNATSGLRFGYRIQGR